MNRLAKRRKARKAKYEEQEQLQLSKEDSQLIDEIVKEHNTPSLPIGGGDETEVH